MSVSAGKPETFWRGGERERETADTATDDDDKVSKLSGKLEGAICSRQSSSQVRQSVGLVGTNHIRRPQREGVIQKQMYQGYGGFVDVLVKVTG